MDKKTQRRTVTLQGLFSLLEWKFKVGIFLNGPWYGEEVIKQQSHRAVSKWKEFLYLKYQKTKIRQGVGESVSKQVFPLSEIAVSCDLAG